MTVCVCVRACARCVVSMRANPLLNLLRQYFRVGIKKCVSSMITTKDHYELNDSSSYFPTVTIFFDGLADYYLGYNNSVSHSQTWVPSCFRVIFCIGLNKACNTSPSTPGAPSSKYRRQTLFVCWYCCTLA